MLALQKCLFPTELTRKERNKKNTEYRLTLSKNKIHKNLTYVKVFKFHGSNINNNVNNNIIDSFFLLSWQLAVYIIFLKPTMCKHTYLILPKRNYCKSQLRLFYRNKKVKQNFKNFERQKTL